jgi:NTE family protein
LRLDPRTLVQFSFYVSESAAGSKYVGSPTGRSRHRAPLERGLHLAAQIEELRAGGSRVETIVPHSNSVDAYGDNMMDLSLPPAARTGYDQGRALAEQLTDFWR